MITRRRFCLAGAVAGASAAWAGRGAADGLELVFAVIPAENGEGVVDRWTPFVDYLSKAVGETVKLRVVTDYAAVIEGQRSGAIQIAMYGPAAFARARIIGVPTEAFAIRVNSDGSTGYYSVFYVLAKSNYRKIDDLKDKAIAFVDPNSTSGNNMPRFVLDGMGIDPDKFFSRSVYAGSHENAVLALAQGSVEVCANWWNGPDDSNLTRMLSKGMLKTPDGAPMAKEDFRIILTSPMIINSPFAYLSNLPAPLKAAIAQAFLDAAEKAPEAFARLSDGKNLPFRPASNGDFDKTIELVKFVDNLRKKRG